MTQKVTKKAARNSDSFWVMVNIRFLLQENLIAQLYSPKISLEFMFGVGKIPFQWEVAEFLNDQRLADSDSILKPCRKLGILRYRKGEPALSRITTEMPFVRP